MAESEMSEADASSLPLLAMADAGDYIPNLG